MNIKNNLYVILCFFMFGTNCHSQDYVSVVREIENLTGTQSGLCVVLNCPDAALPLAIAANGKCIVHGISETDQRADTTRTNLAGSPCAGLISIECLSLSRLPYNNRSVDRIVSISGLQSAIENGLSAQEVMRVLTPNGSGCFRLDPSEKKKLETWLEASRIKNYKFVRDISDWLIITKERNKDLDDWSHRRHGPDGNPVSRDKILTAPNLLQWIVGPTRNYGRDDSGPLADGPRGLVSADGRNYYIQGNHIVARNAFNGILLWIKPITKISMSQIVAVGQDLFICLNGQLSVIDGLTGELRKVFADSISCSSLLVSDGILVSVGSGYLKAFDITHGNEIWSYDKRVGSVCIQDEYLYGMSGRSELLCLSLKDGSEVWRADVAQLVGEKPSLQFVSHKRLVFSQGQKNNAEIVVLNAKDGTKVWSASSDKGNPLIYEAAGLLWVESISPEKSEKGVKSLWIGYDVQTGVEKNRHIGPENVKFRCHDLYATDRFMIANRPLYFMDWETGTSHAFEGTRAQCGIAYCLAQGMFFGLYTTPSKCMCVSTVISGITAFAADETMNGEMAVADIGRFKVGKETLPIDNKNEAATDLWPMYRHDARRSASSRNAVSSQLKIIWKNQVKPPVDSQYLLHQDWKISRPSGDNISAPTIGGGKVYISLPHDHQVVAVDIKTGDAIWSVHTAARVTAPPTYYKGLCLYGCHDGRVYAVRSDNGGLVWSFRAAPDERRMMAYGQLESAWPIAGGVLLVNDIAYVVAGRLTETDGGLYIHALNPKTGQLMWSERRGRVDDKPFGAYQPRRMETYVGTVDLLCSDGKNISMAGSHRGRMDCKTGDLITHYNDSIPFGWNPSRFRTDQYGVRTVPVVFLNDSVIGIDRKTQSIQRSGKEGWQCSMPKSSRVEALVGISDSVAEFKTNDWRPSIRIPNRKDKNIPVIDGVIDPVFTTEGTPLQFVYLNGSKNRPQEETTAWILSDKEYLYMAFRCDKKDPSNVVCNKTKHDDGVWQDEAVEIFLDPANSRTKAYYHFIINAAGVVQDSCHGDIKWNGDLLIKSGKGDRSWTVELRIPFKTLGINPAEMNAVWSVNVNRSARNVNGSGKDEDTAWSPTGTDSSHLPGMFGYMWLNAGKGGDDEAAYKRWHDDLPLKPEPAEKIESSIENLILAAVAHDKGDINKGGELLTISMNDGKIIGRCPLPVSPANDGIAVAGGRVYVTLRDATIVCLGEQ